ncbi:MAG: mannose-6-phosphate isomerase [Tepidisphaera sp.]
MTAPYPLIFAPILKDKVWGGRRLEAFGKPLPTGMLIGESWELADLASTSASGGGGGSAHSVIVNGPLAGKTIRDALNQWGAALLGPTKPTVDGGFPLLVKFLDARENLSVQVHPSPSYAALNFGCNLKTECWMILAAEPGAVIYKGIKPGVTREMFARHIESNEVANDMIAVPAVVGECHNLPSGTCHALGGGVLAAEIQTPSDTTYRVYDWGRTGRELHIEQAMACIDFGPPPPAARVPSGMARGRLVTTEFFEVDSLTITKLGCAPLAMGSRATVVMMLEGHADLRAGGGSSLICAGQTALVPAALADSATLCASSHAHALLACV